MGGWNVPGVAVVAVCSDAGNQRQGTSMLATARRVSLCYCKYLLKLLACLSCRAPIISSNAMSLAVMHSDCSFPCPYPHEHHHRSSTEVPRAVDCTFLNSSMTTTTTTYWSNAVAVHAWTVPCRPGVPRTINRGSIPTMWPVICIHSWRMPLPAFRATVTVPLPFTMRPRRECAY